jgi:hypothetical protein
MRFFPQFKKNIFFILSLFLRGYFFVKKCERLFFREGKFFPFAIGHGGYEKIENYANLKNVNVNCSGHLLLPRPDSL